MPDQLTIQRVNVLGVGVSVLNERTALAATADALEVRRGGYVCVTGVHGVMEAQADQTFRSILNHAYLNTPDGMPMVWLGRLGGHSNMGRVYGPDLMLDVCGFAQDKGCTHFLYGGAEGVAGQLQLRLQVRFPRLKIVGTYSPPFRELTSEEEEELVRRLNDLKPDIIWVGLSTPKQEKFMARFAPRLPGVLMFGVGAAFDFHAGRVRQAPRWIQRSGFEWFFRLCVEPRRLWKRYLRNNPVFLFESLRQLLGLKKYPLDR